jgi:signal transduction histidine kinase
MSFRLKHRTLVTGFFIALLFTLCGVLGVLQYNWIGQVSVADAQQRHQRLQTDLLRISQDFNSELASVVKAISPVQDVNQAAERLAQWRNSSSHEQLIRGVGLAIPKDGNVVLHVLEPLAKASQETPWPSEWIGFKNRFQARLSRDDWRSGGPEGNPIAAETHVLEIPIFSNNSGAPGPRRFNGRREAGWLLVDVNTDYARDVVILELVERYLSGNDYLVDVFTRWNSPTAIYRSDSDSPAQVMSHADASAGLFDVQLESVFPRPEPLRTDGRMPRPQNRIQPDMGRWQIYARNRAGSLEAAVSSTRRKNLAVTGGVLLMLVASVIALLQLTRRTQRLARLQMDFVAGITHELRTPLAVIYGASYNLRGVVARNPEQVERYGTLLQQESGKLRDLVEQVLRFAGAEAGRVIREKEPVSIERLIEQAVESSRNLIQSGHYQIEKNIAPELPAVFGDPVALQQALENLVSNAAKYGAGEKHWIGVTATRVADGNSVEIRVADLGPGIPPDEQKQVFDAFFRGRRALQDQIHGTGLGLNLVKKIVEAHGGSIRVESEPMKRTEFIVLLPAMAGVPG